MGIHGVLMDIPLVGRAQVFEEHCAKVMADGVQCRCHHADVTVDATDGDRVERVCPQRLIEVGLEERAEPSLVQYDVCGFGLEVVQHPLAGGASYRVRLQPAFEDEILPEKTVVGEDDGDIDADLLAFSVPYKMFLEMEENVPDSFLERKDWKKLRGRIK